MTMIGVAPATALMGTDLLSALIQYFPYYVALVLIPAIVRTAIEKAIGIPLERFETSVLPLASLSYEEAFRTFVLTALYFPLFEELIFRGIPYALFGTMGVVVGSIVWVAMHPAWQLQYLSGVPLWKRIVFTVTTTAYYACNAVFYSMMWLSGAGLAAIIYHMAHNAWLTLVDMLRNVDIELKIPWKKKQYRFIRTEPVARTRHALRNDEDLEELELATMVFVKRRSSLLDEAEEAKKFMFVRRRE